MLELAQQLQLHN